MNASVPRRPVTGPARGLLVLAAAAAVTTGFAAGPARAATFVWTGPGGTATSPTSGSWNSAAGTNVWDTDGDGVGDTNTIPTADPSTVLSFGGSGTGTAAYTATDNINGDLLLNRIVNANTQIGSGGAVSQVLNFTGAPNARLVFVANGATAPALDIAGTAGGSNLTVGIPTLINGVTLTGGSTQSQGLTQLGQVVAGTGNFVVNGTTNAARYDLLAANTFTGGATNAVANVTTTLTRGQIIVGVNSTPTAGGTITSGPLGTGTLLVNPGAGATALIRAGTGTTRTLANPVTLSGDVTIGSNNTGSATTAAAATQLTFTGPVTLTGTRIVRTDGQFRDADLVVKLGAQTFAGPVGEAGGSFGLTKANSAILLLTGTAANTYTGTTTVLGGVLSLDKNGATAVPGNVVVGDNSTTGNLNAARDELRFLRPNQVADVAAVTINGGLLNLNGQSEGTAAAAGLGALTVQNAAVIDFGAGATSILHFGGSAAAVWPATATLQVLNYSGVPADSGVGGGGGAEQLLFGNSAAGLTAAQLGRVSFVNPAGLPGGTYGAVILDTGEVVPVPEPTAAGAAAVAAAGLLARRRRGRGA